MTPDVYEGTSDMKEEKGTGPTRRTRQHGARFVYINIDGSFVEILAKVWYKFDIYMVDLVCLVVYPTVFGNIATRLRLVAIFPKTVGYTTRHTRKTMYISYIYTFKDVGLLFPLA